MAVATAVSLLGSVAAAQARGDGVGAVSLLPALVVAAALVALPAARQSAPIRVRARVALARVATAVPLGCGMAVLATFDSYGFAAAVVR